MLTGHAAGPRGLQPFADQFQNFLDTLLHQLRDLRFRRLIELRFGMLSHNREGDDFTFIRRGGEDAAMQGLDAFGFLQRR